MWETNLGAAATVLAKDTHSQNRSRGRAGKLGEVNGLESYLAGYK